MTWLYLRWGRALAACQGILCAPVRAARGSHTTPSRCTSRLFRALTVVTIHSSTSLLKPVHPTVAVWVPLFFLAQEQFGLTLPQMGLLQSSLLVGYVVGQVGQGQCSCGVGAAHGIISLPEPCLPWSAARQRPPGVSAAPSRGCEQRSSA